MSKSWRPHARRSRWSRVSCSSGKIETQESQDVKELEAIHQEVQVVKSLLLSTGKIETQESQGVKELEAIHQEVQVVKSLLLSR